MRGLPVSGAIAWIVFGSSTLAQDVSASRSLSSVTSKLRAEAKKTTEAELSKLFTWLEDVKNQEHIGLSKSQVELIRQFKTLTRDIIRAWLLRDLDAKTAPAASILEERLSERGVRLRARLAAHAEAIVLEGILTPRQAERSRRATSRKAEPLLFGHYGLQPMPVDLSERTLTELVDELRVMGTEWGRAGQFIEVVLGRADFREAFPGGIEHLDPIRRILARKYMPKVELLEAQRVLAERIDTLTLSVLRAWATRDLDQTPLPPRAILAERLAWTERFRDSLFTHAEAITLLGILTQSQADRGLSVIWEGLGPRALFDPSLVSRLRITKSQQEYALHLLDEREAVLREIMGQTKYFRILSDSNPEFQKQVHQNEAAFHVKEKEMGDLIIMEALTRTQLRAFQRIMGATSSARIPVPKVKQPERSSGPHSS
ncbi:hypothetical protein ACYOEI_14730 [Singulisphaera rosea]